MSHFTSSASSSPTPGTVLFLEGNTGGQVGPDGTGTIFVVNANTTVDMAGNPGTNTITQDFGITNLLLGSDGTSITSAARNVGVGLGSLNAIITSSDNVGVGYHALILQDSTAVPGGANVAVGSNAMQSSTVSDNTVAIGWKALQNGAAYSRSVGIGTSAMAAGTNTNSVAIGYQAFLSSTGNQLSTGVGYNAAGSVTSGNGNTAIGASTMTAVTTGEFNIALGMFKDSGSVPVGAGWSSGDQLTATSTNNICIGAHGAAGNNGIYIGSDTHASCFVGGIAGVAPGGTPQMVIINPTTRQLGSQAIPASSISITGDSGGALTGAAFTFTGGTTGLTFSGAGTTETLTGTLAVSNGGTNATSFATTDGTIYYDGTRLVTTATGTSGQVLTSNGAGVAPTYQSITTGTTWSVITANQTAAVNNGYFCNKAGTLTLALPASSAVGDVIEVANINTTTGTQITQAAGQQIFIGNTNTTSGAGGSLTSTQLGDTLKLVCRTANTTYQVVSMIGNWSVV